MPMTFETGCGQATGKARRRGRFLLPAMALALVTLSACEAPVQVRGNLPDKELVTSIEPGRHTRDQVSAILGSPSSISTFGSKQWYYIGSKVETFAFKKPKVLERNILVVSFNDSGLVDKTEALTLADGKDISPVDRITPTEGRDFTIFQQLFGNLGRLPSAIGGTN